MSWFNEKNKSHLTREQLVSEVLKYCEEANRDVDSAAFTEKFTIRGHEYTVSVSCSMKKIQS